MTSTIGPALGSNANSSTNVPSVSNKAIHNTNATLQQDQQPITLHPQLQGQLFTQVNPVSYKILDNLLKDHPNRDKVNYVIQGFRVGFSLKYNGPLENRQPKNLLSAYQHSGKLWASLMKEVHLGRMLGPFLVQPIDPLICLPVGRCQNETHRKCSNRTS